MPETNFMKFGNYITAPEPVSTACFITVTLLPFLGNGSAKRSRGNEYK
jgi:hypothetical protein